MHAGPVLRRAHGVRAGEPPGAGRAGAAWRSIRFPQPPRPRHGGWAGTAGQAPAAQQLAAEPTPTPGMGVVLCRRPCALSCCRPCSRKRSAAWSKRWGQRAAGGCRVHAVHCAFLQPRARHASPCRRGVPALSAPCCHPPPPGLRHGQRAGGGADRRRPRREQVARGAALPGADDRVRHRLPASEVPARNCFDLLGHHAGGGEQQRKQQDASNSSRLAPARGACEEATAANHRPACRDLCSTQQPGPMENALSILAWLANGDVDAMKMVLAQGLSNMLPACLQPPANMEVQVRAGVTQQRPPPHTHSLHHATPVVSQPRLVRCGRWPPTASHMPAHPSSLPACADGCLPLPGQLRGGHRGGQGPGAPAAHGARHAGRAGTSAAGGGGGICSGVRLQPAGAGVSKAAWRACRDMWRSCSMVCLCSAARQPGCV